MFDPEKHSYLTCEYKDILKFLKIKDFTFSNLLERMLSKGWRFVQELNDEILVFESTKFEDWTTLEHLEKGDIFKAENGWIYWYDKPYSQEVISSQRTNFELLLPVRKLS